GISWATRPAFAPSVDSDRRKASTPQTRRRLRRKESSSALGRANREAKPLLESCRALEAWPARRDLRRWRDSLSSTLESSRRGALGLLRWPQNPIGSAHSTDRRHRDRRFL